MIQAGAAGGGRGVNSAVVSGELPLLSLKMLPEELLQQVGLS